MHEHGHVHVCIHIHTCIPIVVDACILGKCFLDLLEHFLVGFGLSGVFGATLAIHGEYIAKYYQ
jgi:hypothetical protein